MARIPRHAKRQAPHERAHCSLSSCGAAKMNVALLTTAVLLEASSAGNVGGASSLSASSPLLMGLRSAESGPPEAIMTMRQLRKMRNSRAVLSDVSRLNSVTQAVEAAMQAAYVDVENETDGACDASSGKASDDLLPQTCRNSSAPRRPGNFHGVKSHTYYVGGISENHPSLPFDAVQSIVASEWYHPGLTATSVWCVEDCRQQFQLARLLDDNFEQIRKEVNAFWTHPDAAVALQGVGTHTTQFDKLIAGNGTWVDVRLWRGRAYNKRFCELHFRTICAIVEASPEIWTNPWSHVLLSILTKDSWVPFHQGHTNGQLTYHFPIMVPAEAGVAELAVVDRGGALPEEATKKGRQMLTHPEERVVRWKLGKTLVFDDSFTHAVRFRKGLEKDAHHGKVQEDSSATSFTKGEEARVVLLMRGWHPELETDEREAMREFVRRGGEEEPPGYEFLPISKSAFRF